MTVDSNNYRYYTSGEVPDHPGESWTRFVCISDTHSKTSIELPPGDVLIHAGDLTSRGTFLDLQETINWLGSLPYEKKVIIAGNHDLCLDLNLRRSEARWGLAYGDVDAARKFIRSKEVEKSGIVYLDHETKDIITSKGLRWKIYGTPAAPVHSRGAFQYATKTDARVEWSRIPSDVEILMTHTPPFNIQDTTKRGKKAGCKYLEEKIQELSQLRLHIFGHIHEAHGVSERTFGKDSDSDGSSDSESDKTDKIIFVNAAYYNELPPIIVDLKKVNEEDN